MALPSPAYWKAEGAGGKAGGAKLEAGCRKTGAPKNPEDPDRDFRRKRMGCQKPWGTHVQMSQVSQMAGHGRQYNHPYPTHI